MATTTSRSRLHEPVLGPVALLGIHAPVIGDRAHPPRGQYRSHLLDAFAGGAVDDAGAVRVDHRPDPVQLGRLLFRVGHRETEIGALESTEPDRRIAQLQGVEDIGAHLRGRGGGESRREGISQPFSRFPKPEVVGPEIVPPLREAMRFVDSEQSDIDPLQGGGEGLTAEPLRGDVDEPEFPPAHGRDPLGLFRSAEGTVDHGGGNPLFHEPVDLVLH